MRRARIPLALLAVALVVAPLVLGDAATLVDAITDRIFDQPLPPPPTVALVSPADGQGVGMLVRVAGEARASHPDALVADVQLRVDGGPWTSLPDVPRGVPLAPFSLDVPLDAPGDHVIEVRASDGRATLAATRVDVRAGVPVPPTVRVLSPSDGSGVAAGGTRVQGIVEGDGVARVLVSVDGGEEVEATVVSAGVGGALWSATVDLAPGVRTIQARADGGLPRAVRVAVGDPAPPSLLVVSPAPGAAFGTGGSDDCDGRCIRFAGVATGSSTVERIRVSLDGAPAVLVNETPGGQVAATGATTAWSWPLPVSGLFAGEHVATFVAEDAAGARSAPRDVPFVVRTTRTLAIVGDDAPRETRTPLSFRLEGAPGSSVAWTLDGEPLPPGRAVSFALERPGDHELAAEARDRTGATARLRLPLFALNRLPVAVLAAEPDYATLPTRFTVTATDLDGAILSYEWDFGDGTTLTTEEGVAEHVYAHEGEYVVNVTAVDDVGARGPVATLKATVPNHPPVARFGWYPPEPAVGDLVSFEATGQDPDGRIVRWAWDFDDLNATNESRIPAHRFQTRGGHAVTLTVTDEGGARYAVSRTVHVRNTPPLASFAVEPAAPVTFEAVRFRDTSVKTDGAIVTRLWDFGDGFGAFGPSVQHIYRAPGRYLVDLTIVDDHGAEAFREVEVVVADAVPQVHRILADPLVPRALDAVQFRALADDREGPIVAWHWDFGDGSTSDEPAPLHRFPRSGVYRVNVTVVDEGGNRGVLGLDVRVKDHPPVAAWGPLDGGYAGTTSFVHADATDPDGRIVLHRFDLDADGEPECFSAAPVCEWTFPRAGDYRMRLTVTDDEGENDTIERYVSILPNPSGLAPPQVLIESPRAGDVLRSGFLVRGVAWGPAPIRLVEVQLRNESWAFATSQGAWAPARGAENWTLLLDTRAFPDGPLDVVVRATDVGGGVGEARVAIRVDNDRPPAAIAVKVANLRDGDTVQGEFTVRGVASHPAGVTAVRWRLDGGPWRPAEGNTLAWAIPLPHRTLKTGTHVLQVDAWHGLDERASQEIRFHVVGVQPVLLVDAPPGPIAYGLLHAEGRVTQGARVVWRVDHELWRDARGNGTTWRVDAPTDEWVGGPHHVSFKALDLATGAESEVLTFPIRVMNAQVHEASVGAKEVVRATPLGPLLAVLALALAARTFGGPKRRP